MDDVMSWDVHLQKFDQGAAVNFDLEAAERVLRRSSGFRVAEPGVGELVEGGSAEIYYANRVAAHLRPGVEVADGRLLPDRGELGRRCRRAVSGS
jgi:hypothetical protein